MRPNSHGSGASAAFAKSHVVFVGAAFVAVTFDQQGQRRIGLQQFSLFRQDLAGFLAQLIGVERKINLVGADLFDHDAVTFAQQLQARLV